MSSFYISWNINVQEIRSLGGWCKVVDFFQVKGTFLNDAMLETNFTSSIQLKYYFNWIEA